MIRARRERSATEPTLGRVRGRGVLEENRWKLIKLHTQVGVLRGGVCLLRGPSLVRLFF